MNFNNDDFPPIEKKYMDCEIHGSNVLSSPSGKCDKCLMIERADREATEFKVIIDKKKIEAGVRANFMNSTLDNYIVKNEKQQEIISKLKEIQFRPFCEFKSIVLVGKTGTGKTHIGISLIDKAIRSGLSCKYVKFYDLVDLYIKEYPEFKKLTRTEFLVIDEYGRDQSEYKSSTLFKLIDKRYDDQLPTVLISNLSSQSFKDSLDDALSSRLKENALSFACNWDDYRIQAR